MKQALVGKSRHIRRIDFAHLLNGEGEASGDGGNMIDFVQRQFPALARFQIFADHLIAADVELPHVQRHRSSMRSNAAFLDIGITIFR